MELPQIQRRESLEGYYQIEEMFRILESRDIPIKNMTFREFKNKIHEIDSVDKLPYLPTISKGNLISSQNFKDLKAMYFKNVRREKRKMSGTHDHDSEFETMKKEIYDLRKDVYELKESVKYLT